MKVFTLWQPWAWAFCYAGKLIENRTWRPPESVMGQRIALHAGKTVSREDIENLADETGLCPVGFKNVLDFDDVVERGELVRGAVVATARLVGWFDSNACRFSILTKTEPEEIFRSPWFCGPVGWLFQDVQVLESPVRIPGQQGLWELPEWAERSVLRAGIAAGGDIAIESNFVQPEHARLKSHRNSERFEEGNQVMFHSIIGGPVTSGPHRITDGLCQLSSGEWVVWLSGIRGCVSCAAISPTEAVKFADILNSVDAGKRHKVGGVPA